jgi:23S rRNA (uracil1939-C5)-methyltransferase
MVQKGDLLTLDLIDNADNDRYFGRHETMGVFVRSFSGQRLAIGDRIEAEVFKLKKNYIEATFKNLMVPSPSRIDALCSHFGTCGGCKWQHIVYSEHLRLKEKQVVDALVHLGGFENPNVIAAVWATELYGYRNKVDYSLSRERFLTRDEINLTELLKPKDFAIGFHAPERYDKVIDIDYCHIATEEMNVALSTVRQFALKHQLTIYSTATHDGFLRNLVVRQGFRTKELMINLVTSSHEKGLMDSLSADLQVALGTRLTTFVNNISTKKNTVAFGETEVVMFGEGKITEKIGDYTFSISANSFFQTNTVQAERLYDITRRFAALRETDTVYDLYCGTGSISIFISKQCKQVFGIELVSDSIADAKTNAQLNGVTNCTFQELDLKDFSKIEPALIAFGKPDVIITDPPRAGMHAKAVETMRQLAPRKIIYVSCNPSSLARDGKLICEDGQYRLIQVQAVDMFPHTNHIESVAMFERTT